MPISKAKPLWQGGLCLDPRIKVVVMHSWRVCSLNCFCSGIIIGQLVIRVEDTCGTAMTWQQPLSGLFNE